MPQMNFFDAELIENAGKYQVEVDGVRVELSEEKEKNLAAKGVKSAEGYTWYSSGAHFTVRAWSTGSYR